MADAVLVFDGQLNRGSFQAFCAKRAHLLSLEFEVIHASSNRVSVSVSGHPVLIDMFEMGCSLGPDGCIVRSITRHAVQRMDAA